jgi:hypothetical protein
MLGAYLLIGIGCLSAFALSNGLCALGGLVMGVLLTVAKS